MRRDDFDAFVEVLQAVSETTDKRRLTEGMISVYWKILERYDFEIVSAAISRHLADPDVGQFMPKPADVIRQIEGGSEERATRAWAKVEQAVTQVGPWRPMAFDDPAIHAVIEEMGGLLPLMTAKADEWNILRAWFTRAYRTYTQRPPTRYPAIMWCMGGRRDELVLIGDESSARMVLAGGDGGSGRLTAETQGVGGLVGLAAASMREGHGTG